MTASPNYAISFVIPLTRSSVVIWKSTGHLLQKSICFWLVLFTQNGAYGGQSEMKNGQKKWD